MRFQGRRAGLHGPPGRVPLLLLLVTLWSDPAQAQVDMTGLWRPLARDEDGSGMVGDTAGVPVSPASQWRVQSWSPEDFDIAEFVCRPHAWDYSLETILTQMRIWADVDRPTQRVVAYRGHVNQQEQETTIWMDGRPRLPENALHTWSGFSTGEWDGDVLGVTTTHLKEAYIRRIGMMRSDLATVRTRWRRIGDYLQATVIIYDPVYLTEPYIRSTMMWVNDPALVMSPYPCEEATETAVPRGMVRHFLPGQSPLPGLNPNITDRFGTPYQPRLGGADTMYPEYIATMKTFPRPAALAPRGSTESDSSQPLLVVSPL
ncbi:MAG: hypothetical protein HW394_1010 [Acidobacteria bacterium]|nr:hypothetical protein [Acidobacteriota bacterium]